MKKNIYSKIAFLIITTVVIFTTFNLRKWENSDVIFWDITSYYAYLPATFIHHDLTLKFTETDGIDYHNNGRFWPSKTENGGLVIKTTMGMSFLYAPFFGIAHIYTKYTDYSQDGFSEPYEMFLCFSSLFYMLVGLFFLRKLLLNYFSDRVTATTMFAIVLGTNLFYYTTSEAPMSHSYNFALIAIFIYYLPKWYSIKKIRISLLLGFLAGLIVLVRPVNAIVVVIAFLLYDIKNVSNIRDRFLELIKNWKFLLVIILSGFFVVLPQLIYWKLITDNWFFNSYIGERFYFNNPHILEGLFSFRKGWLLYTPIMIFSLLGLFFLPKNLSKYTFSIPLLFIVFVYVIFSWWCWWYGGGYSIRPMIDIYAILAIPMATFYSSAFFKKYIGFGLVFILVLHSVFQTIRYENKAIHYDGMTKEAYFNSFGSLHPQPGYWELIKMPDYDKARKGEKEYFLFETE